MTILSVLAAIVLAVFAAVGWALIAYRLRSAIPATPGDVALMLAVAAVAVGCTAAAILVWPVM